MNVHPPAEVVISRRIRKGWKMSPDMKENLHSTPTEKDGELFLCLAQVLQGSKLVYLQLCIYIQ